jgi:spore coat protein A
VLNGSNARTYQLFLVDDTNKIRNDLIRQIGTDAGLMGKAVSIDSIKYPAYTQTPLLPNQPTTMNANYCANLPKGLILSPAERVDLIVDFQCAPGRKLRWVNVAAAPFDGWYAAIDPTDPTKPPQPIDPCALPENILAMGSRLPFPEVMRFDVADGAVGAPLALPTPLSPSFQRMTHESPELTGHTHRWLALNEKLKGADKKDGFLFFNELVELKDADPSKVDFTITLAGESTPRQFKNRQAFFRSPINFYPQADKPEVWHLVNFSADSHPIHLHLVDFQLLSRFSYVVADPAGGPPNLSIVNATANDPNGLLTHDSASPPPAIVPNPKAIDPAHPDGIDDNEAGWMDTVRVNPNEIVTIGMVFKGFTGRFMYHCHILEHEDMDMMRPMVVVPSMVKSFVNDMMMMAGDEPDNNGMTGMPGMPGM